MTNKEDKFVYRFIFVILLYAFWGFIFTETIFADPRMEYLFFILSIVGSCVFVIKYSDSFKCLDNCTWVWLPFLLYMVMGYFFKLQIQNFAFWLPTLPLIICAKKCRIHLRIPYGVLLLSGLIALVGIFVQLFLSGFYNSYILPIFYVENVMEQMEHWEENSYGYAGFTYQLAATAMPILYASGVLLFFRNRIEKNTPSYVVHLLIFVLIIGVFLTGKRSLAAIAILVPAIVFFVRKKNNIWVVLLPVVLLLGYIAYDWFSSNASQYVNSPVLGRFARSIIEVNRGESLSASRDALYKMAYRAFLDNPIFGVGNFAKYTGAGTAVHNAYLQILCEKGIVGIVLYLVPLSYTLRQTIKILRRVMRTEYENYMLFSLFVQLVYILYGMTGNTNVDMMGFILYFLAVAIMIDIKGQIVIKRRVLVDHENSILYT